MADDADDAGADDRATGADGGVAGLPDDDHVAAAGDAAPVLDRLPLWVAGVTVVALVARLVELGARSMHFDEGRVAYWALHYHRTGAWEYRYIVHGPFVQHADAWLFGVLGPTNFAARLPVALVGAALPATALLFRDYLDDDEVLAVAGLFALNPLVLYYSRFMRSDLLVATFSVAALGFLARTWARRRPRYLYLAAGALALAFASKENAVVYWLCWGGMLATVAGVELAFPRRFADRSAAVDAGVDRLRSWGDRLESGAATRWAPHAAGAVALFLAVTVALFAPRSPEAGSGLGSAPLSAAGAAFAAIGEGFDHWGGTGVPGCLGGEETFLAKYACNLGREAAVLNDAALATVGLAVLGYAVEHRDGPPRALVAGAAYWGLASVLGYPLGSDILFPAWVAVHAVVAFAFPAGVGLARVVRWGRAAYAADETVDLALAAAVVVVAAGLVVGNAVHFAFLAPQAGQSQEPNVVQYAQPADDISPLAETFAAAAADDRRVLVYGEDLVDGQSPAEARHLPACVKWLIPTNPASWHMYATGVDVECATTGDGLQQVLEQSNPPVVVATERNADAVADRLGDGWDRTSYRLRLGNSPGRTVAVFVRADWTASGTGLADAPADRAAVPAPASAAVPAPASAAVPAPASAAVPAPTTGAVA